MTGCAKSAASARGEGPQVPQAGERFPEPAQKESPVGVRIQSRRPGTRLVPPLLAIAIEAMLEEHGDRIATGDEMIVGESEIEERAAVDREEAKRGKTALARERRVELTHDLQPEGLCCTRTAFEDGERDGFTATGKLITRSLAVQVESRQSGAFQSGGDLCLEACRVAALHHAHDVHRRIRMQIAPPQHRGLEQIEPSLHAILVPPVNSAVDAIAVDTIYC